MSTASRETLLFYLKDGRDIKPIVFEEIMVSEFDAHGLRKQPDPRPPDRIPSQTPSLWLYLALITFALILTIVAFVIEPPDWPGLLLNLSTELIGAIIILMIIDRQIRQSELGKLASYVDSTSVKALTLFSRDVSNTLLYARVLNKQLSDLIPEFYIERPHLGSLLSQHPNGFILIGDAGTGKSTLLQAIVGKQTKNLLHRPRQGPIPLLYPMRLWTDGDLLDHLWSEIRQYAPLKRRVFDRWLENGRLLLIFDGINENVRPELALNEIINIRKQYPQTAVIVSSRTLFATRAVKDFEDLGLPFADMPKGFTELESAALYTRSAMVYRYIDDESE